MTDVDSSLKKPETLATLRQEEQELEDTSAHSPQAADAPDNVSHGGAAMGDEPGHTRDVLEGSEVKTALLTAHTSPEGLRELGEPEGADPVQLKGEEGPGTEGNMEGPTSLSKPGTGDQEEDKEDTGRASMDGQNHPPPTSTLSNAQDVDDVSRQEAQASLQSLKAREARTEEAHHESSAMVMPSASAATAQANRHPITSLEGAGLPLKPQTAHLPPVARGQVRGQQMTSSITDALKQWAQPLPPRARTRSRRPPKYIRLTSVTVLPARARQLPQGPSLYCEQPRRSRKVITWEEATSARPPLRIDMEGPGPCTYTPRVKPLNETNAPAYTFGSRCQPEKDGGSRTSWSKTWFQTPHIWHNKVDFTRETTWPSPNHYIKGSCLGPRQRTMPEAPSYTFGHKMAYSIVKPGASQDPSPNEYQRQLADKLVLARGPSFTHQLRREGTVLWGASEVTPGPAAYSPQKPGRERPSFTIQGPRREKSHMLGPYSSL